MEQVTGETPDISKYLDFGFYDWVWYKDNAGLGRNCIRWWLGIAHQVGNLMSYWILSTEAGCMIAWTTVQHVTNLALSTVEVQHWCQHYDQHVTEILNDENHIIPDGNDIVLQDWNEYPVEGDPDFMEEFQHVVSDYSMPEQDDNFTPDVFDDTYLHMEIALPRGGDQEDTQFAKVVKWLHDKEG